jgi:hypothetical protein
VCEERAFCDWRHVFSCQLRFVSLISSQDLEYIIVYCAMKSNVGLDTNIMTGQYLSLMRWLCYDVILMSVLPFEL